jgi:hypothetical protein
MTTDPFAAFFADAHRQWRTTLEQGGLGDKQELERRWQSYLHDADLDRMKYTARSKWHITSRFIK